MVVAVVGDRGGRGPVVVKRRGRQRRPPLLGIIFRRFSRRRLLSAGVIIILGHSNRHPRVGSVGVLAAARGSEVDIRAAKLRPHFGFPHICVIRERVIVFHRRRCRTKLWLLKVGVRIVSVDGLSWQSAVFIVAFPVFLMPGPLCSLRSPFGRPNRGLSLPILFIPFIFVVVGRSGLLFLLPPIFAVFVFFNVVLLRILCRPPGCRGGGGCSRCCG